MKINGCIRVICLLLACLFLCSCGNENKPKKKIIVVKKPGTSDTEGNDNASSDGEEDLENSNNNFPNGYDSSYSSGVYDSEKPINLVKKAEITAPYNSAALQCPISGGADKEADVLRKQIINASDRKLNITGRTYYVSNDGNTDNDGLSPETAWSIDGYSINNYLLEPGDGVLFRRGDIFRSGIAGVSGVSYGAYGKGAKPALYGSKKNYASEDGLWEPSNKKYVWKLDMQTGKRCQLVLDHGKTVGRIRANLTELEQNGDFYHNDAEGYFYFYCDKGYPNKVYESIEIGGGGFNISGNNITIDNLCIKYSTGHAINGVDCKNIKISNCEIGWAGGGYLESGDRFGNGIEFYNSASDILVENCYIYQCYDTGITFQSDTAGAFKNITFKNNLIEYCTFSIEFFSYNSDKTKTGIYHNIDISNNILRFAGYGWSMGASERANWAAVSNIVGWSVAVPDTISFVIKNNIFDVSLTTHVYWYWTGEEKHPGLTVSGNSFYSKPTPKEVFEYKWIKSNIAVYFSVNSRATVSNQAELEVAIKAFDSNPKTVKWLG